MKILQSTIIISLVVLGGYIFFEPQLMSGEWSGFFIPSANAATSTAETAVTLSVTGEINLNCSSSVTLLPTVSGQTGGTATGTFGCVVTTNNSSGYNLSIKKNQKLQIADVADQRFDDYATSTAVLDWDWSAVGNGNERFGFAVNSCASSTDIVQAHRSNGSDTCNTGAAVSAWHCFAPIPTSPSLEMVANRTTATPAVGVLTVFGLQAQAGGSNNLQQGTYNCTTTVTAASNP